MDVTKKLSFSYRLYKVEERLSTKADKYWDNGKKFKANLLWALGGAFNGVCISLFFLGVGKLIHDIYIIK